MDLIEKAARKLGGKDKGSVVERAAGKITGGKPAEPPFAGNHDAAGGNPDAPGGAGAGPAPDVKGARSSRRGKVDFEGLSALGMITPHGEPTQIAEEFRVIKRSLLSKAFDRDSDGIKNGNLILVSSAQPGEGKTFCAINLAMSVATERDLTVLLVDADFANPSVLPILGLKGERGLFDVIDDENIDLADCLIRTDLDNLSILPAGRRHHLTTELLASERMRDIVDDIVMRYPDRLIIIDSPPVLASSAPGTLASFVGQILFVVEAERTNASQIKAALMQISSCGNINMILNKSKLATSSEMFSPHYGHYYGSGRKSA